MLDADRKAFQITPNMGAEQLGYYSLAGRVVALSIIHKAPLGALRGSRALRRATERAAGVRLSTGILKQLLGKAVSWEDLEVESALALHSSR
jgi:hypothetical protein